MAYRRAVSVLLVLVLMCLAGAVQAYAEGPPDRPSRLGDVGGSEKQIASDDATPPVSKAPSTEPCERVLVRFAANTSDAQRITALNSVDAKLVDSFDLVPGLTVLETSAVTETIQALKVRPDVLYAEPDYLIAVDEQLYAVPNDPDYASLWGMENIHAPDAWDISTGDANMVVAVIDSGVNYTHPDLSANVWTNPGEIPSNGIDDDGNGYVDDVHGYDFCNDDADPMDDEGHGSHCAGTIGGVGNNSIGVAGVNWNVKIMALKFMSDEGEGWTSDAIACLEYAVQMGAQVSNNSWGGGPYSTALYDAIQASQSIDHLFIAAAGNDYLDNDLYPQYPSSYDLDNIISVAAINANDTKCSFSNWGATSVDLGAPGSSIYSTVLGSSYEYYNGTSMAAPHVTGAAAFLYGLYPHLGYEEVRNLILHTTRLTASMSGKTVTGGVLDLGAAVDANPCTGSCGNIAGTIYQDGVGTTGVLVKCGDYDTGEWTASSYSDSGGNYLLEGVDAGSYYVVARPATNYYSTFYDEVRDWEDATPVTVVAGTETSGIDINLIPLPREEPDDYEPDDSMASASQILSGNPQTHSIYPVGDADWAWFELPADAAVTIETSGETGDTVMMLYDEAGTQLAFNDDHDGTLWSLIEYNAASPLPAGLYYVEVYDYGDNGTIMEYQLALTAVPLSPGFDCTQVTEIPCDECEALVALYQATYGDNWTDNTNWLETYTPSDWYGVNVSVGHVTSIWLESNALSGSLPSELGNLGDLRTLALTYNQLTGPIPSSLGGLSELERLGLADNALSGTIPTELGNLESCTFLNLALNQLSGTIPASLGNLDATGVFALHGNQLTGAIPPELGNLTNAWYFSLGGSDLTGTIPSTLGQLTSLQEFYIYDTQLSGPIPDLSGLISLNKLWLSYNNLWGTIPSWLGEMSDLTELHLDGNGLSGAIPSSLGNLTSLTDLRLAYNALVGDLPTSMADLAAITILDLSYNGLWASDAGVDAWATAHDANWKESQTITPGDLHKVSASDDSVTLGWTPIAYQSDGGSYRIAWSTSMNGTDTIATVAGDKSSNQFTAQGLDPDTDYWWKIQTFTLAHGQYQQSDVYSPWSDPVLMSTEAVGVDPYEPDDSMNTSSNITTGDPQTHSIYPVGDADWVWFELSMDAACSIETSGPTFDTTMALYDAGGNQIAYNDDYVDGFGEYHLWSRIAFDATDPLPAGLYFVRIEEFGNSDPILEYQLSLTVDPICANVTDIPCAECEALVALYQATDGDNWTNNTNWLESGIVESWHGVTVEYGHVISLFLYNNGLNGELPNELASLTSVEMLDLGWNDLSGAIPSSIGDWTDLQYLYLDVNRLSGSIPEKLGNLENLSTLWLANNALDGEIPASLAGLDALGTQPSDSASGLKAMRRPTEAGDPVLADIDSLTLDHNCLYTSDPDVDTWATSLDSDWKDTQTIAPADFRAVNGDETSVTLAWTPISYQPDGGYYYIYILLNDGSLIEAANTENLAASSVTVPNLQPGTTYRFQIMSYTLMSQFQKNYLGGMSAPITGSTQPLYISPDDVSFGDSADIDGDGMMDTVIWRQTNSTWYALLSSRNYSTAFPFHKAWGSAALNDQPMIADLDGDARSDLIVWRPASGTWYALLSSRDYATANYFSKAWGSSARNDMPLVGDLDGDSKADLIVWRPANGTWYGSLSSQGYSSTTYFAKRWGSDALDDMPIPADLDGDGKTDLVVWRPANGTWYGLLSSQDYSTASYFSKAWGSSALDDVPIARDLDGDSKADLIVWRSGNGTWYGLRSSQGYAISSYFCRRWGSDALGDVPVAGDLDADGKMDLIVWRTDNSTWYGLRSLQGYSTASYFSQPWGSSAHDDLPMIGR